MRISLFFFLISFVSANLYAQGYTWVSFPQMAAGGGYTTYITISDPLKDEQGEARAVGVLFYDPNGDPLTVTVTSDELGTTQLADFKFDLQDLEEISFTVTSSTLVTGRIEIYAVGAAKFNSSVRYAYRDSFGRITDVVGVLPSNFNYSWTITLDKQEAGQRVGVAIANWWYDVDVEVYFDLYKDGMYINSAQKSIPAMGQLAIYVDDATLFPDFTGTGTLRISCFDAPISVMATRDDGSQFSSLPADAEVQLWKWSYTVSSTTYTGYWSWRFTDDPTFVGSEHNSWNPRLITVRGVYDTTSNPNPFFILEWWYVNSDDPLLGQGTILFQGTPKIENGKDVITGTRIMINAEGITEASDSFSATRIY